jgi:hypothetical protein
MQNVLISLTDDEYAMLVKTQELMRIAGGAAETADAYAEFILKSAIASYAVQYPNEAPSAVEVAIYKDAAARAEARAAAEADRRVAAEAKLVENVGADGGGSLADQLARV